MILLNNPDSPALDALNARYVVSLEPLDSEKLKEVNRLDDAIIYQRTIAPVEAKDGRDFTPGWNRDKTKYEPTSFRLGAFISLCALGLLAFQIASRGREIR